MVHAWDIQAGELPGQPNLASSVRLCLKIKRKNKPGNVSECEGPTFNSQYPTYTQRKEDSEEMAKHIF